MIKKSDSEKVMFTFEKAERALLEIISEGGRVSQSAVEKRAGLSNGALNYDVPLYRDLKARIQLAKANKTASRIASSKGSTDASNDRKLKDRYRLERDQARSELRIARGEILELRSALFDAQQYCKHLESKGLADSNIIRFKRREKD